MSFYTRLISMVSEVTRLTVNNMVQPGIVAAVKGDKVLPQIGNDMDGKPVYGPWLNTGNLRAGARERRAYKPKQNVMLFCPAGDPRQALLLPFAPNKNFMPPAHATDANDSDERQQQTSSTASTGSQQQQKKQPKGEETWQCGDLRVLKNEEGTYSIFLLQEEKKQQSGGELDKLPDHKSDIAKKANAIVKLHAQNGITGRIGDNRFMAHSKGVKLRTKKNHVVVTDDDIIFSKPPILGKDPLPNDDKNN